MQALYGCAEPVRGVEGPALELSPCEGVGGDGGDGSTARPRVGSVRPREREHARKSMDKNQQ